MVLVVGATGLVGGEICKKLSVRGEKVRALVGGPSAKEKIETLRRCAAEICVGDFKDPDSIRAACRGVDAVISTASSTLSWQAGDSIESVDGAGQMNLVKAAKAANVARFVFVSFRRSPRNPFPLGDAKRDVREGDHEHELLHHSGELVHRSLAESGAGIRLRECNRSHLWAGHEPHQLGFIPGCRRNMLPGPSTSGR